VGIETMMRRRAGRTAHSSCQSRSTTKLLPEHPATPSANRALQPKIITIIVRELREKNKWRTIQIGAKNVIALLVRD
jgi:hypothetical protein